MRSQGGILQVDISASGFFTWYIVKPYTPITQSIPLGVARSGPPNCATASTKRS